MKSGGGFTRYAVYLTLIDVPIFMTVFYTLRHIQIPHLYQKGKTVSFIGSMLITTLILIAIWAGLVTWLDMTMNRPPTPRGMSFGTFLLEAIQFYSPAMGLLAWESYQDRHKSAIKLQRLEKDRIATELKFLKTQLNPHFLFNTLNNLYSYVITKSPKAPEMILYLSGILDYVLYKSRESKVTLAEEVETISHFLELEKIRYGQRLKVDFSTSGALSASISPLLLLSIVENAFKHGASGDIESPVIKIKIHSTEERILCTVSNTKSPYIGELNDEYKKETQISNIRRQLQLIYPDRHLLEIDSKGDNFSLSLTLESP